VKNLLAAVMTSTVIKKETTSENNSHSLFAYQQNPSNGDNIFTHDSSSKRPSKKRQAIRFKTNGIVALTSFAKPVVTNIYDIAPGGVSFLHANEWDICNNQFKMDILIFDKHSDSEYFISQVTGRVKSRKLVTDLKSNTAVWRFSVEFIHFDSLKQRMLQTFCRQAQQPTARYLGEHVPSISYDS
jgi:hypothetical protein